MLGRLVVLVVVGTCLLVGCASSSKRQQPTTRELKAQADLDFDAYARCMRSAAAKHVPATETPEAIVKAARSECRRSYRTLWASWQKYWMNGVEPGFWTRPDYDGANREAGRQVRQLRTDTEEMVVKWLEAARPND